MREIELKLTVAAADLPQLRTALAAMAAGARADRSSLTSTYYDTPDRSLQKEELTCRVRRKGRRFFQTVKAADPAGGGPLVRGEWEDAIAGERPDLAAPTSGKRIEHAARGAELRPLFASVVRRTALILEPRAGTRIEAALDEGEIRTADGERAEPVSELELELKLGDPAVLYDVALRLLEVAPLRIDLRSKAERGYRLLEGERARPLVEHARPVPLDPAMTVEATLQAISRHCLAQVLRNEAAALDGLPDGVHQMRVAVRRLRSALAAVKPLLPAEHYRWAGGELKWLADALAPARNWDILSESLLRSVGGATAGDFGMGELAAAVDERRRAAHRSAIAAIASTRYTAALLRLSRWFEGRGWRDQPVSEHAALLLGCIGEIAPKLVARRYKAARKRSKGFARHTPAKRHELRIALKKLRYTIEFLAPLFDRRAASAFLARLRPLQDELGHVNDVRVAHELIDGLARDAEMSALARAGGAVLGWHDRGVAEREAKLRKHVRRFRKAEPFW
jgi:inorganic triphosphatase YgiF